MPIDVTAEVTIDRPREDVARYAMNPDNDTSWIGGIVESKWVTDPPVTVGTQVARFATFLGRRIEYVNEVVSHGPTSLLVMRSVKGPFPMTVTYAFEDAPNGAVARIRVEGGGSGFYTLVRPLLSREVKRRITKDLRTLKSLLESGADSA